MAILFAVQSRAFDLLGLTTLFGNAPVELTTRNALRIVEISGADIPVYKGASTPVAQPLRESPDFVHGADGLGNTEQPPPRRKSEALSAAAFIVECINASPGEVTLVPLASLTNLALAMELDPSIIGKVKEIVLMGGSLRAPGNVTPVAEANIIGDPHAADLVFNAGWPVTMVGLDVTTKILMSNNYLKSLCDRHEAYGSFIHEITRHYMAFHTEMRKIEGGMYVHDSSALMYLLHPELFEIAEGPIRVITEGPALAQTIQAAEAYHRELPPWADRPNCRAAVGVDAEAFLDTYEAIMLGE